MEQATENRAPGHLLFVQWHACYSHLRLRRK
jgi:hypothetical protein